MQASLSHISAAAFWLAYGSPGFTRARFVREADRPDLPGRLIAEFVDALRFQPAGSPVSCLVSSQVQRRDSARMRCHSCAVSSPDRSFLLTPQGLSVCAPELTFVHMATLLSQPQLIHFGMMLCGIYAKQPLGIAAPSRSWEGTQFVSMSGSAAVRGEQSHRGDSIAFGRSGTRDSFAGESVPLRPGADCAAPQAIGGTLRENVRDGRRAGQASTASAMQHRERSLHRRRPVSSAHRIAAYISDAARMWGLKRARAAVPFLAEGSASPMESAAYLMLCLPHRMGGYALPRPLLNARVYVDGSGEIRPREVEEQCDATVATRLTRPAGRIDIARRDEQGREYFECDLAWPQAGLVVDYHGRSAHGAWSEVSHDLRRGNILLSCGYDYLVMTKETLGDTGRLAEFAESVAMRLGAGLHPQAGEFARRQRVLRDEIVVDPIEVLLRSLT